MAEVVEVPQEILIRLRLAAQEQAERYLLNWY